MAPGSRTTRRSFRVNLLANISGEKDELAGARSNAGSNKTSTPPEVFTPPLVPPPVEDFFTKFIKVFMETTQTQVQALVKP